MQLWEQLIGFPAPPRAAPAPGRPIGCAGTSGAALREVVTNARDLALGLRRAPGRNKPGQQSGSRRTLGVNGRRGEASGLGLAEVGAAGDPEEKSPIPGAASAQSMGTGVQGTRHPFAEGVGRDTSCTSCSSGHGKKKPIALMLKATHRCAFFEKKSGPQIRGLPVSHSFPTP